MAMSFKLPKWALIIVVAVAAAAVFGYLKLFMLNPERQMVAQINGHKITVAQFNRELANVPAQYRDLFREEPRELLQQLIAREILLQEARRQGVKSDPSAKPEEAAVSQIQGLLKKEVIDKVSVTKEEVENFYKANADKLEGKTLAEVTPLIDNFLREMKAKEKASSYMAGLQKNAKIEIDEKRIQAIAVPALATDTDQEFKNALKSGQPVLVDFGSNNCIPCRQIRPILKEIKKEYTGKAHVVVIDIYKFNDLANDYRVQVIPTLVFFDKTGKEVFRHLGAWDKASIIGKMKEAGVV